MSKLTTKNIILFICWLCVVAIAVLSVVGRIITSISDICRSASLFVGIFGASLGGIYFSCSRRNKLYLVTLILAIVLIAVFYIL